MSNVIALQITPKPVVLAGALIPRLQAMNAARRALRTLGFRINDENLNLEGHRPVIEIEFDSAPIARLLNQCRGGMWVNHGFAQVIYSDAVVKWRAEA